MLEKFLGGIVALLGLTTFVAAWEEPVKAKAGCCCRPAAGCCQAAAKEGEDEAKIKANLEKLPEADRKLALAQRFCAVEADSRLGSMGVPLKIMVKDQPVFLCCKGCQKDATADADKTLARVKELRAKYGDK
jgi:hypothetical protein